MRDRGDEGLRVRVFGRAEELRGRAGLDDAAGLEHDHAVGDRADHPEVVADEEIAQPVARLKAREQIEDPRAHREIEGRDGLVEHDQVGAQHERARERDALALAA
ncbi:MAG: hypothetical protein ACO3OO_13015 [Gemmobacter sp.]